MGKRKDELFASIVTATVYIIDLSSSRFIIIELKRHSIVARQVRIIYYIIIAGSVTARYVHSEIPTDGISVT